MRSGFWWQYRGFLAPARKALFLSALMRLSKAFDSNPRSISLPRLLSKARENREELAPHATRNTLRTVLDAVDKNKELLQRLRDYRNTRLAHFDPDSEAAVGFPSEDLQTLVEETKSIHNSLWFSYHGRRDDFDEIMEDVSLHASQLITIISETQKHG